MSAASNTSATFPVRRLVVWLTIGSFSVAALMGVIALLSGGSFGEREGQVLMTTLIVGTTSVAMLCYLATSGTRFQVVGVVGGISVLLPFVTALLVVWGDVGGGLARLFGVGVTIAATLAQVSLLLALAASRSRVRLVLWATVALAAAVAAVVVGMILTESGSDGVLRLLGVLAILDVLGTVTTLALALFGTRAADEQTGGSVRIPGRLEQQVAGAAVSTGTTREQVVEAALERYFARPTEATSQSQVTR